MYTIKINKKKKIFLKKKIKKSTTNVKKKAFIYVLLWLCAWFWLDDLSCVDDFSHDHDLEEGCWAGDIDWL